MKWALRGFLSIGLPLITSCAGPTSQIPQRPASYALRPAQQSLALEQGREALVEIRLERTRFDGAVELRLEGDAPLALVASPQTIAWSFSPNPVPGTQTQSSLSLKAGREVPPGSYSLRIRGQSQGLPDQTAPLQLQVQPRQPFTLTALVLYGRFGPTHPGDCYPIATAARFHLLDISAGAHNSDRWCEVRQNNRLNAFEELKRRNPRMRIYLYYIGPPDIAVSVYDPVSQQEWDWIRQNHGIGSPDRWISVGVQSGEYLRDERWPWIFGVMNLGNPNWRRHWMETRYDRAWGRRLDGRHNGAHTDGIFLDNMEYNVRSKGIYKRRAGCFDEAAWRWVCQDRDHPDLYYNQAQGQYREDLWQDHYRDFLNESVPFFRNRGLDLALNPWRIYDRGQIALYETHGVLVFEECGFLCPEEMWDRRPLRWEFKLETMRQAQNYRIITGNRVPGTSAANLNQAAPGEGLQRMDRIYPAPCTGCPSRTGWQWLWFALGSYWLAYNFDAERPNAYFHFSAWEYRDQHWFEEYDPQLLHLGRPLGPALRASEGVWWRPFEEGWVAVNANPEPKSLSLPLEGWGRLLDHENFRTPERAPRVNLRQIPLEPYHGAIILKE